MITLCAWGNGIPWAPSPAAPLAGTDRSSRGASPHALSSCHLRSGVNGAETRRPHNPHRAQRLLRARSTKAGAKTPATLDSFRNKDLSTGDAQRRAGPRPRRHQIMQVAGEGDFTAQRRPGPRPRRHALIVPFLISSLRAQRRPGPRPRRHRRLPGAFRYPFSIAQRRPGPRPRRHALSRSERLSDSRAAQRRPGPRPRRQIRDRQGSGGQQHRSTKAGAETPATPRDRSRDVPALLLRSTKAGTETPATQVETPLVYDHWWVAQRRPGPRPRRHGYDSHTLPSLS